MKGVLVDTNGQSRDLLSRNRAPGAAEAAAAAARNAAQLLLFRDIGGRTRGIRLSVIERVEEVPALALFEKVF